MSLRAALIALIATMCLTPSWAQDKPNPKVDALLGATLAALQKTEAPPVVDVLSAQASSLLAVGNSGLIRTSRLKLKDQPTWTDKPFVSAAAKLTATKIVTGTDATRVTGTLEDGAKKCDVDGSAVSEGGKAKWLQLAIVPAGAPAAAEAEVKTITDLLAAWRDTMTKGNMDGSLKYLAPDSCSMSVAGPDYGFYVEKTPAEVRSFLVGQATASGPLSLADAEPAQVDIRGPVALVKLVWQVGVTGFPVIPVEFRGHLYRDGDTWRIAGVCGLRVD